MSPYGNKITDTNALYRMFLVVFAGIMAFAVILSWRAQLLFNTEPATFLTPRHKVEQEFKDTTIRQYNSPLKNELTK